jgi:hypothetical protein
MAMFAFSCKKDDDSQQNKDENYLPMKVGNYWVYEQYKIDSAGVETKLDWPDSVVICSDTIIRGNKYYAFKSFWPDQNNPQTSYYRDSTKYIVDVHGRIYFSLTNSSDILYYEESIANETDTIYSMSFRMLPGNTTINVPSGLFNVKNFQGTLRTHYPTQTGTEVIERKLNKYYAPNVGLVLDTYCWIMQRHNVVERRLIRYHIEEE